MSVTAEPLPAIARQQNRQVFRRLVVAAAAVLAVAGAVALLTWLLAPAAPPPPARTPFGMAREAAPAAGGIGGMILTMQGSFYRSLQAAVMGLKDSGAAIWSLLAIGFAYGVFHAAGPGHGKAVIASYLVASERALVRGVALSFAAALLQALVAIALVSVVTVALRATASTMGGMTNAVELASFAAVAVLGAVLTWRKSGKLIGVAALTRDPLTSPSADSCGHIHLPPPDAIDRIKRWREMAGVVIAAGIRPCSGAIVLLVFAVAQGLFAAGIAATFTMAAGTALTTSLIAALAVFAKALALRLAGGRGSYGSLAVAGLELAAAAFVLVLGVSLLAGLWTSASAS